MEPSAYKAPHTVHIKAEKEMLGGEILKSQSSRRANLERKFTCGIALDFIARVTFTAGLFLATYGSMIGLQDILTQQNLKTINITLAAVQIIWGVFLGGVCLFGMSLIWGKRRCSPKAAFLFIIGWVFTTVLVLTVAATWIFSYHSIHRMRINECRAVMVPVHFSFGVEIPPIPAPKARIDACIDRAKEEVIQVLIWGLLYVLMFALSVVTVAWSCDYRRRIIEIRGFQCLQDELATAAEIATNQNISFHDEKLGLVHRTAPIGARSRTLGPTKAETLCSTPSEKIGASENDYDDNHSSISPLSPMGLGPGMSHHSHLSFSTIRTNTGLIPVMHPLTPAIINPKIERRRPIYEVAPLNVAVRHSEVYSNPLPELVVDKQHEEKNHNFGRYSTSSSRYSQSTVCKVL